MTLLYRVSNAPPTTLAASLAATGNPVVNSITNLPQSYPFKMLIDWGSFQAGATQEAIYVTGAPTGTGPWTLPCTRGVDGTTPSAHVATAPVEHGVSAEDFTPPADWVNIVLAFGADPTGVHDSTAAIQTALNNLLPGQVGYLMAGIYKISAPIFIPPLVGLAGSPASLSIIGTIPLAGSVIQPSATFAQGSAPYNAAILVVDQVTGGYSVASQEQHCQDIVLDGTNLPATSNVDGVCIYSAPGQSTGQTNWRNILIRAMTGWAWSEPNGTGHTRMFNVQVRASGAASLNTYAYTATNASPCVFTAASGAGVFGNGQAVTLSGGSPPAGFSNLTTYYVVNSAGTTFELSASFGGSPINSTGTGNGNAGPLTKGGFQCQMSDSQVLFCGAYNCTGDAWQVLNSFDSVFSSIHGEHSTNGYGLHYKATNNNANPDAGGIIFANVSIDAGNLHGVFLESSGSAMPPVKVTGFVRRPGAGSSSSGYAGVCVNGYFGPVDLDMQVYPGLPDGGGGFNSPQYALSVINGGANTTNVSVRGTWIGASASWNIDGTQAMVTIAPETTFGQGQGNFPGTTVYTAGATLQAANGVTQPVPVDSQITLAMTGTVATSHDRSQVTNSFTPVSGTVYFRLVRLVAGVPINHIGTWVAGTAKAGGTHGWAGITSVATGKVVAISADQTDAATTWGTINAPQPIAVASTYVPPVTGAYWEFFCVVATTMPAIGTSGGMDGNISSQIPIFCGPGASGQTTPPAVGASLAPTSGSGADDFWIWSTSS